MRAARILLLLLATAVAFPAALATPMAAASEEAAACGFPRSAQPPEGEPPLTEACTGSIRPGAQMTAPAWCTLSFVLTDASGNLYIGTAAHCVRIGQRVSANGVGAFGTVVSDGALGVDYALIRIDDAKKALVDPSLCQFGGPIGADPGDRPANDVLLEYGWGSYTYFHEASRGRELVEVARSANVIEWAGVGSGGDSGGPVVSAEGYAVASHTYGQTPQVGVFREGGPTFARMLASGQTIVPTLTLVTADASSVSSIAQTLPR